MATETPHWTQEVVPLLKGAAISGVVLTHVLSSLPGGIYTTSPWSWFFIALDQTLRFCVPLFLALSGYALARKYYYQRFELKGFLQRRLWKLLPLYFVWSAVLMLVLSTVPQWRSGGDGAPVWYLLLTGGADYHLYFIPMIFQLYVLFPVFWWVMRQRRWRELLMAAALISQFIIFYYVNRSIGREVVNLPYILTDQGQYLLFTSWWGYFLVGMGLAYLPRNLTEFRRRWQALVLLILFACWGWIVSDAWFAIQDGLDPLYAMRFTRWPVLAYATTFIVVSVSGMERWSRWLKLKGMILKEVLMKLGKYSFLIYLSHTLLLRLVFSTHTAWSKVQLPISTWFLVLGVFVLSVGLSVWLQKRLKLNGG